MTVIGASCGELGHVFRGLATICACGSFELRDNVLVPAPRIAPPTIRHDVVINGITSGMGLGQGRKRRGARRRK